MLVGEAPGEQEVLKRAPFVGASGSTLDGMLHDAGIMRSECFITNVCRERPPGNDIGLWIAKSKKEITPEMVPMRDKYVRQVVEAGWDLLKEEIHLVKPNVIVAFGNVSLWSLTGKWGIKSWRGSLLSTDDQSSSASIKVIPVYHPAYIMRDWSQRHISVQDLRRAKKHSTSPEIHAPEYSFILRPNYSQVMEYLDECLGRLDGGTLTLSVDIETRAGHIACLGISLDTVRSICIPFMCVERQDGYWSEEEEYGIIRKLKAVLTHPNARVVGQNFIYDTQYIWRHWGFAPRFDRDTMLGHHSCFSGLPKGLDYISSLYCEEYVYWKDDGKNWNPKVGENQLWAYNCTDCVRTFECDTVIQSSTDDLGLRRVADFQQAMFWPVLQAMVRGVKVDTVRRGKFALELSGEIAERERWLRSVLGHPINPKSPLQMRKLFYEDLHQKEIFNRKSGTVTCDDEALQTIARREPLLRPLVKCISEFRSLGVFLSTFVGADLDKDSRLRCSYNIAGTETFRLSSSENAFGSGLNLQNIPKGGSVDKSDAEALNLPNVRTLFVPDEGYTFWDLDLQSADAWAVAWESNDDLLKQMLREGVGLHEENAKALGVDRELAKRWVHGTNYGGGARTMAISCGITVHKAETLRARWFQIHPGIADWHTRTESQLRSRRYVENAYGYRRYYFDRIEALLPEALAWVPQSTVGCAINRLWMKVYLGAPEIWVLLQNHDALAGQFPSGTKEVSLKKLALLASEVVIPYPDPLVIPSSIKTSTVSWGDCK
jgi:DNA polymerase I-like protein with 3'-5' exonuclease and polymerase domains/uracil-DNA glycosylase